MSNQKLKLIIFFAGLLALITIGVGVFIFLSKSKNKILPPNTIPGIPKFQGLSAAEIIKNEYPNATEFERQLIVAGRKSSKIATDPAVLSQVEEHAKIGTSIILNEECIPDKPLLKVLKGQQLTFRFTKEAAKQDHRIHFDRKDYQISSQSGILKILVNLSRGYGLFAYSCDANLKIKGLIYLPI